jgi:hypothetical protein
LNFKCGLNLGAARERVRVAHALEGLPKIAASMGRGELSYSKVRGYRRAQEAKELSREAQQQMNRSVNYWFEDDGSLVLKARLPALAGAMLVRALDAALEYQVVVHVDAEVLRERTPGRCEIDHGPSVPAETARRLACDSSLLSVLENEHGEPLNVGRKTRSIPPPAIRRALNTRDAGCRFPGCTHQRYVDAHHVEHWADGSPFDEIDGPRETSYAELDFEVDEDAAATRWRGARAGPGSKLINRWG